MRTIYVLIAIVMLSAVLLGVSPVYASMQGDVDQAASTIERFQAVPERGTKHIEPKTSVKDSLAASCQDPDASGPGRSGIAQTG